MKSNAKEFKELAQIVLDELFTYIESSQRAEGKVLNQEDPKLVADQLELSKLIKEGSINQENIQQLLRSYLHHTQHMHHPHYIGHQVAVPHLASGFADMIHGVVNNPMAIYEMGPAAATMEKVVINWMLEKIGWFKAETLHESDDRKIIGGGVLTHGGSLANLTALLAARAHISPDTWEKGVHEDLYVLLPETSHYSLSRSASIMGLGSDKIIPIEVDQKEQVIPDKLRQLLHKMAGENKKVMAVVANACATGSGLYDPIDEMGDICQEFQTWFHIDGAHGAGALLSDQYRHLMKGADKADSMIWDAHKMLRTSALSAAVLLKDHRKLDATFHQKGSYLIFDKEQLGYDFMNNTVECTKAALGSKLFWALAAEGEKGITEYIENQYERTKIFHQFIHNQDDFECPYSPESNILCFKYTGLDSSDEFQLKLRNEVVKEGNFYITSTLFNGRRHLRLTVMNPDTDITHIEHLMHSIRKLGKNIEE